ncbi:MAG TPA: type IV pili twitching motility protein PilT [Hydrogenophaga sp.]|uniref:PilT/PilU family type 4a pilus ATPase n=1 Tax=Hydrogenophaga sp. TaxID=1904254 RepID=UPI0008D03605|nr:PilT/PilU family type 4a pilus ATPase [Hydrogenophaga sp.]OGA79221.1 MAG: type IV pili twitching motility protein PilT [Burkholderiales bacterium GWE1_65_30]OGA92267.1 MAG: type IV pili twitching motility protein PilT [Burkholderiales bacterium GWF1_66_17]HAX19052.1 type IV pili twitching motility protein PilT [Hydrogenophaga sp.]HBU17702.1 type IV pili twitching motility protein PilT [Hydrogenophaga sp.]
MDSALPSNDDDLGHYLSLMVSHGASDLFLSSGSSAALKVQGVVRRLSEPPLDPSRTQRLAYSVMRESQIRGFEATLECDLAIALPGLGRFRVNVYRQRGDVAVVVRHINARIPSLDGLKLPPVLKKLAQLKRGLVLVVGAAGSGKSTTLAAMLDHRNRNLSGHILTVEDPMEFEHSHGLSIVDQREVGLDTQSFDEALRHAMREAPDVIMIGEIRDRDTMQHAMAYAETGHLCVSTLHANNANQAIQRILNFFPETAHRQILMDLSLNLKGVVGQRLIRGVADKLVPAVEVMLLSPYIADLIQKGQTDDIKETMSKSTELGMATFDQSLYELYERGELTAEQAVDNADSRTDLSLRIRLHHGQRPDTGGLHVAAA